MGLFIKRTAIVVVPGHGTIRIVPRKGRQAEVSAPDSIEITDRKGRPMSANRRRNGLTGKPQK